MERFRSTKHESCEGSIILFGPFANNSRLKFCNYNPHLKLLKARTRSDLSCNVAHNKILGGVTRCNLRICCADVAKVELDSTSATVAA